MCIQLTKVRVRFRIARIAGGLGCGRRSRSRHVHQSDFRHRQFRSGRNHEHGGGNSALVQLDLSTLQSLGLQASNIQKATLTVYVKVLAAAAIRIST